MHRRVILASLVAFVVALGLGRVIFKASSTKTITATELSEKQSALKVTDPVKPVVTKTESHDDLDQFMVKTAWKRDGTEASNDNQLFKHLVSYMSTDGTTHSAKHAFGAFVHWVPYAREILQDGKVVSSTAAATIHGEVENGSQSHF